MIYCPQCGTANRDGSKFCSNCAARLAPPSGLVCPMCGTSNPVENVFCSKCGARLVPLTTGPESDQRDSPPIKGLSLPAKPASTPTEDETEDVPITREKIEDWLTKLRESPPVEDESAPVPPPKEPPVKEFPDWAQVQTPTEPAQSAPSQEQAPASKAHTGDAPTETPAELPVWLKDLTPGQPRDLEKQAQEPTLPQQSLTPVELPPWLQVTAEDNNERVEPPPTPSQEEQEQVSKFQLPTIEPQPESKPIEPARADEIPSWIAGLAPTEALPATSPPEPETQAGLAPTQPAPSEDKLPRVEEPKLAEEPPVAEPQQALATEIPPSVVEQKPAAQPTVTEAEPALLEPARAEEIPPWIAELKPTQEEPATPALDAEPIKPEDLDEWLRLPTLESRAPIISEELPGEPVQIGGPLAGMRGVLPLAQAVTAARPAAQPAPVERKDGAHLFEEILAEPVVPAPRAASRRVRADLLTMRPVIYIFLTFAIILALIFPPNFSGSLLIISGTPAAEFYDYVQSLPSNSTVLVAFDYDPSLSGEMNLISLAILRHLVQRRINIIALSTLEQGPLIAQRVLTDAAASASDYRYGVNYLNLGLIPGHEPGLAQLAKQGFRTDTRDFDQNQLLSQYPLAKAVKNIKSIPMVIELAGTEDTLRMWVEQYEPRVNARIAAGVSAAVEPKARTYRDASQLVAVVSGPTGAAQYEILSNQQGEAVRRMTAQSAAQIILIMVILAGNAAFWISRVMEKK